MSKSSPSSTTGLRQFLNLEQQRLWMEGESRPPDADQRSESMELRFKVSARIARPVAEVFEAVADPAQLSGYFTTGGAVGRLETGKTVQWDFADFPGAFPVEVVEVEAPKRIVLKWEANEGPPEDGQTTAGAAYMTTVVFTFTDLKDGRTLVEVEESGWRESVAN